jgi:hypothetical protein
MRDCVYADRFSGLFIFTIYRELPALKKMQFEDVKTLAVSGVRCAHNGFNVDAMITSAQQV